jgi:hypothetical protein
MIAIAFQANPDKWTKDGTMLDYLENEDGYIYWSTPEDEVPARNIRIGTPALILRTASTGRFGPRAIIAVGTVAESPKKYRSGGEAEFALPARLKSTGDENATETSTARSKNSTPNFPLH